MLNRIIPILLLKDEELVKSKSFHSYTYIGDILNSVKIYNELEADELCIFDISSSSNGINYDLLSQIATECFMPVTYGGNITSCQEIEKILRLGIEKVSINTALSDLKFVSSAVDQFGQSTIVACVDYIIENGTALRTDPVSQDKSELVEFLEEIVTEANIGEVILQNKELDGSYAGYDLSTITKVKDNVHCPIVVAGGCSGLNDIKSAFQAGCSGAAAGSLFVYYTDAKGILINYPDSSELEEHNITR